MVASENAVRDGSVPGKPPQSGSLVRRGSLAQPSSTNHIRDANRFANRRELRIEHGLYTTYNERGSYEEWEVGRGFGGKVIRRWDMGRYDTYTKTKVSSRKQIENGGTYKIETGCA